jgi:hypothetical protein
VRRLLVLLFLVVCVPSALADGDPASDLLLVKNAFLPYPAPTKANETALQQAVASAYAHGYRLKVAVIASQADLGSVPSLFGKPQDYAEFLGQELKLYYVGPLLIAMPSGYGIYDGGRSTRAEQKVLAAVHPSGSSADDLAASTADVVRRLVASGALKSKDITEPYQSAFTATIVPGKTAHFRYATFDDSGKTRERLAVRDGRNRVLKSWSTPFHATKATSTYFVAWNVPKNVPKSGLKFCLSAFDPSGNHAATPSCAAVAVKQ